MKNRPGCPNDEDRSDIIQTDEEGVALLGRIYILGKYQRPVLVKLPVDIFPIKIPAAGFDPATGFLIFRF